jgi:4a-hydroxytetrahydrobiopterin dehydratase
MTHESLARTHCQPLKGAEHVLDAAQVSSYLEKLPGWALSADGKALQKDFRFKNFDQTIGFVNALAWFANVEDHHPELEVGYGRCAVTWSTHDVGGISMNDVVCAAKTDELMRR